MKHLFLFVLAIGIHGAATAQDDFYLKAEGALGATRMYNAGTAGVNGEVSKATGTFRSALTAGIVQRQWLAEVGIGIGRTGGRYSNNLLFEGDFDSSGNIIPGAGSIYEAKFLFTHFSVPLTVGYSIPLNRHLSLQPRVGLEGAWNAWATRKIGLNGSLREEGRISDLEFDATFKRFTLFGAAALQLQYRINPRIALYGGISYHHAITNMLSTETPLAMGSSLRTSSSTADVGVLFFLKRSASETAETSE